MIKLCRFPDADAVAKALAKSIVDAFQGACTATSPVGIMLAGGRTPKHAYQLVAESGLIAPDALHILLSDERHVPADHPDSNLRMLTPFLDAVRCTPSHRVMVNTALTRDASAADFGNRLASFFTADGILQTCYLGLGADGHTASIFNVDQLRACDGRDAIDVDRPDGKVGISATPRIIRRAARIVFVVTGSEKRDMATNLLMSPTSIVAGQVVLYHPRVELWVDRDAAPAVRT